MIKLPGDNSDEISFFPMGEVSGSTGSCIPTSDAPIFVDDTMADWGGKSRPAEEKNNRLSTSISVRTLHIVLILLLLGLIAVALRTAQMQILKRGYYTELAEGNRSRIEWLPAERGVMFDRLGKPLVGNAPRFTATITPADLPQSYTERQNLIGRIAEILNQNPRDIEEKLIDYPSNHSQAIPVAENINYEQAILIEIASTGWPAIQLVKGVRREYPMSESVSSLAHLIGYESIVNEHDLEQSDYLLTDRIGRTGLEQTYENYLRGTYGRRRIEVDALGRQKTVIAEEDSIPGSSLELAIDSNLQAEIQLILQKKLRAINRQRGSVIVMQPNTGEILAMVNLPSFNNNLFAQGISVKEYAALSGDPNHPLFARSISAALPSGSTFKLVIAAAALTEGLITPRTTFFSSGGLAINNWFFPDWKAGGHGLTNITKALSESVNTFFYIIGGGYENQEGLGVDRIIEYARKFGFGQKSGIDLPGEGEGFLPSKEWKETTKGERWYIGDTYHLAIGQGDILVTPLQIAVMTTVFANGGRLIEPHLVNAIISQTGQREEHSTVVLNEQVVSPEIIDQVRLGMRESVLAGSSRAL
ncbi:penicillin-binding protein 2, partial [Patescibacteria group bacterium]|nr:penicillin-binding protein 2 [Patescibacteria group bacterium]